MDITPPTLPERGISNRIGVGYTLSEKEILLRRMTNAYLYYKLRSFSGYGRLTRNDHAHLIKAVEQMCPEFAPEDVVESTFAAIPKAFANALHGERARRRTLAWLQSRDSLSELRLGWVIRYIQDKLSQKVSVEDLVRGDNELNIAVRYVLARDAGMLDENGCLPGKGGQAARDLEAEALLEMKMRPTLRNAYVSLLSADMKEKLGLSKSTNVSILEVRDATDRVPHGCDPQPSGEGS